MQDWEVGKVVVEQKKKGSCIDQKILYGIRVAPNFGQPVDKAKEKWEEKMQEEVMVVVWQA